MIFVNSMSDLFHEDVPPSFIQKVFRVMHECRHHTFHVLTKRSGWLMEISSSLRWSSNIWMGVSVESAEYSYRVDDLRNCGAQTKFLSLEPLIGDVGLMNLDGINWAIAGGESGPGARDMNPEWVRSIRDQCIANEVAFHFKQWGGVNKKRAGRLLDGRTWDELPTKVVA